MKRMTVYNNFPDDDSLLGACQAHWLALHPPPDPTRAFALQDPAERLRTVLSGLYAWYRENSRCSPTSNVTARSYPPSRPALPPPSTHSSRNLPRRLRDLAGNQTHASPRGCTRRSPSRSTSGPGAASHKSGSTTKQPPN